MTPLRAGLEARIWGPSRRQLIGAGLASAASALSGCGHATGSDLWGPGARLTADFEPVAAMWLGYDPGHETFTADLAAALQSHVALRMIVRDEQAELAARALLGAKGVSTEGMVFLQNPQALFFVRDAAVFCRDATGGLGVIDFRWSHYGWASWCQHRFSGNPRAMVACAATDTAAADALDRSLTRASRAAVFRSRLAMEGGGVEVNGQGLLIANEALWQSRNPGLSRARIEQDLLALPGVRRVIWLPAGLAQDPLHRATIVDRYVAWGTGGHTDEFVRFADPRTVLLAWPDEAEAARHPVSRLNLRRMQRNHDVLSRSTDLQGRPLRVLKLPLPRVIERRVELSATADSALSREWTADSFPPQERRRQGDWVMQVASSSYLNFVLANGLVLLPDYLPHGTPRALQDRVRAVMEVAFPGRELRFVDAVAANWLGGGAHCATLTEPLLGA
jgi:agmatine deiminase